METTVGQLLEKKGSHGIFHCIQCIHTAVCIALKRAWRGLIIDTR